MTLSPNRIEEAIEGSASADHFSGVVRVRQDRDLVFQKAYGYAQRGERISNNSETRFATASGCKIFTALSVLQLVEAGRVEMDQPLSDQLVTPYPIDRRVTVRHLLTHTSGLHDYLNEQTMSHEDYAELYRRWPVHTLIDPTDYPLELDRPLDCVPGEQFRYNNGAFVALAWLVEQAGGESFSDYVENHIFGPAGMAESGYFRADELPGNTAYGYLRGSDGGFRSNIYSVPVRGSGDGGAFVTARDWSRFWDALYGQRLLASSAVEEMIRPQVAAPHDKVDRHYGLGIWITQEGQRVIERYVMGGDLGVGMVSTTYAREGVELTILDNIGDGVWSLWRVLGALITDRPRQ